MESTKTYTVTLRLTYGRLIIDNIQASNEDEAIDEAMEMVEADLWTCRVVQVESR